MCLLIRGDLYRRPVPHSLQTSAQTSVRRHVCNCQRAMKIPYKTCVGFYVTRTDVKLLAALRHEKQSHISSGLRLIISYLHKPDVVCCTLLCSLFILCLTTPLVAQTISGTASSGRMIY